MGILDRMRGNPFEKLKKDDLETERIKQEREEKLRIAEVEKLSLKKKNLFDKGFTATDAERRALARQMEQHDQNIKLKNIQLKKISDQIRVVDNLLFIHDNKQMFEKGGLMKDLADMDKSKLDEFLARANLAEQKMSGNLEGFLSTMQAEYGLAGEIEDDKATKDLMDIWSTSDISESDDVFQKWDKEKAETEEDDDLVRI